MTDTVISILAFLGAVHLALDVGVVLFLIILGRDFRRSEEAAEALRLHERKEKRPLSA